MSAQMSDEERAVPARRPPGRVVMRQDWLHLLFLHQAVDPDILRPLLPPELELDTYQGKAYIGLIPFTMKNVHPVWTPVFPGLSAFHETNVRTYVTYRGGAPGVWFFSLDASSLLAVSIARFLWHLPYYLAHMELDRQNNLVRYASKRRPSTSPCTFCIAEAELETAAAPAAAGSLEYFLVERYLLYAKRKGRLYRGQVHHTPYSLQKAKLTRLEEDLIEAAGIPGSFCPDIALYAEEVNVDIYPLTQL